MPCLSSALLKFSTSPTRRPVTRKYVSIWAVNGIETLDCLDFDDDRVGHHEVRPVLR